MCLSLPDERRKKLAIATKATYDPSLEFVICTQRILSYPAVLVFISSRAVDSEQAHAYGDLLSNPRLDWSTPLFIMKTLSRLST